MTERQALAQKVLFDDLETATPPLEVHRQTTMERGDT
jgi:hypothetical protein